MPKPKFFIPFSIFMMTFLLANSFPAGAQTIPLQETDLYPGGQAAGIYTKMDSTLFIVDQELELWVVNPQTGAYLDYYPVGGDTLMDISFSEGDMLWWADDGTIFGNLNLTTNVVQSWSVDDLNPDSESLNLGPVIYDNNQVWLASWYGPKFGLFRFNPGTQNLCLYHFPPGLFAADLIAQDDVLWMIDWSSDSLLRMDPANGNLVKYPTGRNIQMFANLQSNGSQLWWTEDILNGDLIRFNPSTDSMTNYNLPVGEHPNKLNLLADKIWYTNKNGSFGVLNPILANSNTVTLTALVLADTITPECIVLGTPYTDQVDPVEGILDWTEASSTMTASQTGLHVFSLPTGAAPWGIKGAGNFMWISDPGRQKLVRMSLEDVPLNFQIYLPLIFK
jgi:hypothetical protein